MVIYNTTESCYNYYTKMEREWKSLCGNLGKATFSFTCSKIGVFGTYIQGQALTTSNYLQITVTVTKAGTYDISATTDNGYYFTTSGTFATTGTFVIYAYGVGTPTDVQKDTLIITQNGIDATCDEQVEVSVLNPAATYNLNCSSISVNGTYKKGIALSSSNNTITLSVNATTIGSYTISTETKNGILFSASGTFTTTGNQSVTLLGSGTPTVHEDFDVTITSNSPSGTTTCTATIEITLPALKYAIISTSDYSWGGAARKLALDGSAAFGTSGVVKIESLTPLWTASSASIAVTNLNSTTQPDIILYYAQDAVATNTTLMSALATYVNNGGVLLYGTRDNDTTNTTTLLNGIFGSGIITTSAVGSTSNPYLINSLSDDPIINGPFGNIAGRYWGEDNSGTLMSYGLPSSCVQIASANNAYSNKTISPNYSIIWYSTVKNFVYIGDSVWGSYPSGSYYNTTNGTGAAAYSSTGLPESKLTTAVSSNVFLYNSYLELNALAWGLKRAATNGINSY